MSRNKLHKTIVIGTICLSLLLLTPAKVGNPVILNVGSEEPDNVMRRSIAHKQKHALMVERSDEEPDNVMRRSIAHKQKHALRVKKADREAKLLSEVKSITGLDNYHVREILRQSEENDIELYVLLAVFQTESSFIPERVNKKSGATGLGQILPSTGRGLAKEMKIVYSRGALKDPIYNIRMSAYYLGRLKKGAGGNWRQALKWYGGTSKEWYPNKVLKKAKEYKTLLGDLLAD